jgi:hypothetical protein
MSSTLTRMDTCTHLRRSRGNKKKQNRKRKHCGTDERTIRGSTGTGSRAKWPLRSTCGIAHSADIRFSGEREWEHVPLDLLLDPEGLSCIEVAPRQFVGYSPYDRQSLLVRGLADHLRRRFREFVWRFEQVSAVLLTQCTGERKVPGDRRTRSRCWACCFGYESSARIPSVTDMANAESANTMSTETLGILLWSDTGCGTKAAEVADLPARELAPVAPNVRISPSRAARVARNLLGGRGAE